MTGILSSGLCVDLSIPERSSKAILGACITGTLRYLTPLLDWYGVLEQINLSH